MAVILLGWAYAPTREFELAAVTGRVTCGGHPLGEMEIVFLPADERGLNGAGVVHPDGSFLVRTLNHPGNEGLVPGKYRVCFSTFTSAAAGSSVDRKYQHPQTSGLLVQVLPGSNEFVFSLPEPGLDPTLAQHR
jgi:hypothetical protein